MTILKSNSKLYWWIILFLIYTPTTTFLANTSVGSVLNIMVWAIIVITGVIWLKYQFSMSNLLKLIMIYSVIYILATLLNHGDWITCTKNQMRILIICVLFEKLIQKDIEYFFGTVRSVLFLLIAINLVSMIVLPGGITQQMWTANVWNTYGVPIWIFGKKNNMILWLFIGNLMAQLHIYMNRTNSKKGNIIDYLLVILTIITSLYEGSSTSIFVISLLSCFLLLRKIFNRCWQILNIRNYMIVVCTLLFILFSGKYLSLFSVITNLFGKDITFSGRTILWEQMRTLITNNLLIGNGYIGSEALTKLLDNYLYVNLHNTFLDILFSGGFLLFIPFVLMIISICKKLMFYSKDPLIHVTAWAFFALSIEMCFEALNVSMYFWILLVEFYYLPHLVKVNVEANSIKSFQDNLLEKKKGPSSIQTY